MRVQARWLAAGMVLAVATAGWFGWRQAQWRRAFYVETTGQLIYQLDMAERSLVRARESGNRQEKVEAMATAHGYLVTAHIEANALMKQMAPFRKGKLVYMPSHAVVDLIQYARNLSPDLPDAAVSKRIDLLDGLGKALASGLPDKAGEPGHIFAIDPFQVKFDQPALKQRLQDYFQSMNPPEHWPRVPIFEDEPNKPTVTVRQQGSDLLVRVDWAQTYSTFPFDWDGYWLLARPASGSAVTVTSDAGKQHRMEMGAFEPFESDMLTPEQHEAWKDRLPPGWEAWSYAVIRVPAGLPQTLTLHGVQGELFWLRPRSGEKAVQLPVSP